MLKSPYKQVVLKLRRGFLNRVRKFDSCRGHPAYVAENARCAGFSFSPTCDALSAEDRLKPLFTGAHWRTTGAQADAPSSAPLPGGELRR